MTTTSQIQLGLDFTPIVVSEQQSLVIVVAGGHEFAIDTDHINGVYLLAKSQNHKDLMVAETPEGELPVLSLAEVLAEELGLVAEGTDTERSLIVINYKDQTAALRVSSVSRPVEMLPEHFFSLPRAAHATDDRNVVASIAMVDPGNEDPNEAVRLVIDPLALFGFRESNETTAQGTNDSLSQTITEPTASQRMGQDQILAFSPEFVSRHSLEYVFCLPLSGVAEVISVDRAMQIPFQSEAFQGFVLWRNQPVPVIDLGRAFGHQVGEEARRSLSRTRRLIIARASNGRYVGFYTQKQMHAMKVPDATTVELESLENKPSLGAFKTDFGVMVVPDLSRILDNS